MILPGQSHISRVCQALWQQPVACASVMVGSGFSRNSIKAGPDAREFPLWQDVATRLCSILYPSGDGARLERAKAEAAGTSGFLCLAQEYEAAFGRGALYRLIRELVPDEDYLPGDIHVRLLRLPWRYVFTTNWDTLLERTRSLVADRAYSVVRTPEEIPSAPTPRIVKLHGSFPAHIPFIFTEEDYRTYPKQFAPFVNTVQQAMMETVFLLIGFSGDDPNFLHWSGWVRDNLGESMPKIYLAGWLDLSPHRIRMLERRNVIPIDLAHHPQATKWPDHLRHRYATEWILHTLEHGQPYEVTEWPFPPDLRRYKIPDLLQPVGEVTLDAPVCEPGPPARRSNPAILPKVTRAVLRAWEQNRKVYPGWLLIPPSKHLIFEQSMYDWERAILHVLPEFPLIEKLLAIREFVWRRENLLEPLSEEIELAAQAILDGIDCEGRRIGGTEDQTVRWAGIREAWREVALALVTAARQRFDRDVFDRRLAALHPFLNDHPDVAQRVHHEKCLWALCALDFPKLEKLLAEWHPEGCDPAWMTRKAAILVETDHNDEAVRLLNHSLSIVREASHVGTLASRSREGWTLWMALAFENDFSKSTDEVVKAPPVFRRWKELAALQCDAFVQKRDFLKALDDEHEKKDSPLFDLGARRGQTISFSNVEYKRWVGACRAIRLCEVAGLPPSVANRVIASDILTLAADRLINTNYTMASRLALRLASSEDDATFNRVWARSRIAVMPMEVVDALVDIVINVITYALPRGACMGTRSIFWVTRLRVTMEALSRLVLRLPPERAKEIFNQGLSYYRMNEVAKQPWLGEPTYHLLARAWESLPKALRVGLILDVLSAPIVGLNGFETFDHHYHDPGDLLIDGDYDRSYAPDRLPEDEGRWIEIVHLLIRGLRTGGEARRRAASRLVPLVCWDLLTASERDLVAQALWQDEFTGSDTLPSGTDLHDWVFLLLPEPEAGLAEQRFRRKWSGSQKPREEKDFNKFLWCVGTSLANLKKHQRPLTVTKEDCASLADILAKWIEIPVSSGNDLPVLLDRHFGIREAVSGLQSILLEIDLSPRVAEALFAKVAALNQTDTPAFRISAGLAKLLPERLDEIVIAMRVGLSSDNTAVAEEAVFGLFVWLVATSEEACQVRPPALPSDLLREVGVMIASRRKGVLDRALQVARWIFSSGSDEQRDSIAQLTLHGLRYLVEELHYNRGRTGNEVDIPLLRWGCAHLALAMSASGYEGDPTVIRWAEIVQNDPLPEVRHTERPASSGTPAERA